ncbi:hypothetical protein M413DRAFT_128532 [Hebeloma cylindrosporum]|uniref:Uncharacterized protein n=1 Tax=Hebeloma cylindrosporum TaxID=76867 RepID=A0A0C3CF05_HEBCY|nr:hypothetical protein M413DRAFT_128532 [Hebeloma cylindrosporum h7]
MSSHVDNDPSFSTGPCDSTVRIKMFRVISTGGESSTLERNLETKASRFYQPLVGNISQLQSSAKSRKKHEFILSGSHRADV